MLKLPKYSMGVGDRFAHQGRAQLQALMTSADNGVAVAPVWNKSAREHGITHTSPGSVRKEADAAVATLKWDKPYFVDADHINAETVDDFIDPSDFFTLDVAAAIDGEIDDQQLRSFIERWSHFIGELAVPGIAEPLQITAAQAERAAKRYLPAVKEAGRIFRRIAAVKPPETFVTEVSMDETDDPQTPAEMLFILAAIADEKIPVQTIAPRFSGRFNKGVDYVGDTEAFRREFESDLAVIDFAVKKFDLPENLKLSVHSGSDKFSIYGCMREAIHSFDTGLHLKTAGTTWLEELIGLAEADGEGLEIAREIYTQSLERMDELCGPYAEVIDIHQDRLPGADEVRGWSGQQFAAALRHEQSCPDYNPDLRQLLHVAYKVAAEMGSRYTDALEACESSIAANVTRNLYDRHIKAVFG